MLSFSLPLVKRGPDWDWVGRGGDWVFPLFWGASLRAASQGHTATESCKGWMELRRVLHKRASSAKLPGCCTSLFSLPTKAISPTARDAKWVFFFPPSYASFIPLFLWEGFRRSVLLLLLFFYSFLSPVSFSLPSGSLITWRERRSCLDVLQHPLPSFLKGHAKEVDASLRHHATTNSDSWNHSFLVKNLRHARSVL